MGLTTRVEDGPRDTRSARNAFIRAVCGLVGKKGRCRCDRVFRRRTSGMSRDRVETLSCRPLAFPPPNSVLPDQGLRAGDPAPRQLLASSGTGSFGMPRPATPAVSQGECSNVDPNLRLATSPRDLRSVGHERLA